MHKRFIALVLALLGMLSTAHGEGQLTITVPETVVPGAAQAITVQCPAAGTLTLHMQDDAGREQDITQAQAVSGGESAIPWDGCTYAGMPLRQGFGTVTAELHTQDGAVLLSSALICIEKQEAALTYALPSADTLYLKDKTDWSADCAVTKKCVVCMQVSPQGEPDTIVRSVRKGLDNGGLFRMSWDGRKKNGKAVSAGEYQVKFFLEGQEERAVTLPLTVCEGKRPVQKLAETASLLPETQDEQALWAKLTEPLTVVDIGATEHQSILAEPDKKAAVLGTVHGQTQGLEVVSLGKTWAKVRAWRHEDGAPVEGYVPVSRLKVLVPGSRYGIVIDKQAQELRVYENGEMIGCAQVSTGLMATGKLFRETRAGAFLISDRLPSYRSGGVLYLYPIRFDGGNLLHQVGYDEAGSLAGQTAQLGQKASEGCVRVDWRTDDAHTVNAWWLWTHIPRGTKVLVLDDAAAREARLTELAS